MKKTLSLFVVLSMFLSFVPNARASTLSLDVRVGNLELAINQLLNVLSEKSINYDKLAEIKGTVAPAYDDSLYASVKEEQTYEKYALKEIDAYISNNNIDLSKNVVFRESTGGKLIPSKSFTVVPSREIVKKPTIFPGIMKIATIPGSVHEGVVKAKPTSTVVEMQSASLHKRWWGWKEFPR
jgi:hypothetical protein